MQIVLRNGEDPYQLRSVVAVSETEIVQGDKAQNIITGCVGMIMKHGDFASGSVLPNTSFV